VDKRIDHLALPKTAQDRELLQGYAQVYMREIGDLLLRMPRPLLLLLKTNDCLRAVDNALGSPMNTVGLGWGWGGGWGFGLGWGDGRESAPGVCGLQNSKE